MLCIAHRRPAELDDRRCARDGPEWRRRRLHRRPFHDAPVFDRRVAHVTIVEPHHPLFGRRLPVVDRPSPRGVEQLIVKLPDGRERSVRRTAPDLAGSRDSSTSATAAPRISARSLLPLANRIRIMLEYAYESLGSQALPGRQSALPDCSGSGEAGRSNATPLATAPFCATKSVSPAAGATSSAAAVGKPAVQRDE